MLYKKIILFASALIICLSVSAQKTEVPAANILSGTVYDAVTKKPVMGVSVSIQGLTSSITDENGAFGLKKTTKNASLTVKAIGYATQIIPVKNKKSFNIYLNDASLKTTCSEIEMPFKSVQNQKNTSSLTVVEGNRFKYRGVATSEDIFQGEAGLNTLARSGAVGSGSNFYIRGFNSLNAKTQPLIVVDGMPFDNSAYGTSLINGNLTTPLSYTDIKDIETVTVIKDGTALFGSRGANGVIYITTLKPEQMATKINFQTYMGVNFEPASQYEMMNAGEYRNYLTEMQQSSGNYTQSELGALPYINNVRPSKVSWGWDGNKDYYRYNKETDWQDVIFRNSMNQNYYIDIKGGDDIAIFALSLGYLNHKGVLEGTDFSRYTARFNSRYNMSKRLTLNANMSFNYGEKNLKDEGEAYTNPIRIALSKSPFMTTYIFNETDIETKSLEQADILGVSNPYVAVNNTIAKSKNYRFYATIRPEYTLYKNLSLKGAFGLTTDRTTESTFYPMSGMKYEDHRLGPVHNMMGRRSLRDFQLYGDLYLSYFKNFNSGNDLNIRAGMRYENNSLEEDWSKGYNSSTDNMKSVGSGDADYEQAGGFKGDWRWLSYYANAEYSAMNKYFVSLNASLDASSRFGENSGMIEIFDTPLAGFGSASFAWLVSSEEFIDMPSWLNLAKIRLSAGTSGNDEIGNYASQKYYTSVPYLGQYGIIRGNLGNSDLKWETAIKRNVGVDLAFLDDRIKLTADLYSNNTENLLCYNRLPSITGLTNYWGNNGKISNKGFEIALQGRVINKELKWDLGVNVSRNVNKLVEYGDIRTITQIAGGNILTQVNYPVGLFYGYKTDGIYKTDEEAEAAGFTTETSNGSIYSFTGGDVKFVNVNRDDKIIDENDMTIIGDPNPDLFGSFNTSLKWKKFTASALLTWSLGGDIYNSLRCEYESMTGTANQTKAVVNRWRTDNYETNMPKAVWGDPAGNSRFSDRWIEDGSYAKLKTLTVAYELPINNIPIVRNAEVYVTGNNLFTLTRYLGYDPEFNISQNPLFYGIDTGLTPQSASVLVGIRIGL